MMMIGSVHDRSRRRDRPGLLLLLLLLRGSELVGVVREPISPRWGASIKTIMSARPSVRPNARRETQAVIFITLNRTPLASIFHRAERASSRKEVMCDYLHTHPAQGRGPNANKRSCLTCQESFCGLAVIVADHNFLVFMPRSKLFTFLQLLLFSSSYLIFLMGPSCWWRSAHGATQS